MKQHSDTQTATGSPEPQQTNIANDPPAGDLYLKEYKGLLVTINSARTYEDSSESGIIINFSVRNDSTREIDLNEDTFYVVTDNKEKIGRATMKSVDLNIPRLTLLPGGNRESVDVPFEVNPDDIDEIQFTDIWGDPIYRITNASEITVDSWSSSEVETSTPTSTSANAAEIVDPNAAAKADTFVYEELYANYENALIEAINAGDFSLVEHMLLPGSSLYKSQKSLVESLSERGITEELISYEIVDAEQNMDSGVIHITVHEVVKVIKPDGESEVDSTWVYTVTQTGEGLLQFSDIQKP